MSYPTIHELQVGINQPNQLIFPEILVSSLAGERLHGNREPWSDPFVFNCADTGSLPRVRNRPVTLTYPTDSTSKEKWIASLTAAFEVESGRANDLAEAFANELQGVKATNSSRIAAVPVTPATAILQSLSGVVGSMQPERYDLILNQIYKAGVGSVHDGPLAGDLLVESMRHRLDSDEILMGIERSVRQGLLARYETTFDSTPGKPVIAVPTMVAPVLPDWLVGNTPFTWFSNSWKTLTSRPWLDVLPARRWVDWLATVARIAVGMSVLWQARLWDVVGDLVLGDSNDYDIDSLLQAAGQDPLIEWQDSHIRGRSRNVQVDIRTLIARGSRCEGLIGRYVREGVIGKDDSLDKALPILRQSAVRDELRSLLSKPHNEQTKKNRQDAVESCLTARSVGGRYADHYGFLVRHGKGTATYRVVDPSTEVMAIFASLACGHPDSECTVGDVRQQLRMVGLFPSVPEVVRRLVDSGLSVRTADASDAVVVRSAFRGVSG